MSIIRNRTVSAIEYAGSWGIDYKIAATGNKIENIKCSLQAIREDEGKITKVKHEGKDYKVDHTLFTDIEIMLILPSESDTFHKVVDEDGVVYQIMKREERRNGIVPHNEYSILQERIND